MALPRKQQKEKLNFLLIVIFFQNSIPGRNSQLGIIWLWILCPREKQKCFLTQRTTKPLLSPFTPSSPGWCPAFFSLHPKLIWRCLLSAPQQVPSLHAHYPASLVHYHHISPLDWFSGLWLLVPSVCHQPGPLRLPPQPRGSAAPSSESFRYIPVTGGHQELARQAWALESGLNFHRPQYSIF